MHHDLGAQATEVVDKVEGEAVVVVDQNDHIRQTNGLRGLKGRGRAGQGSPKCTLLWPQIRIGIGGRWDHLPEAFGGILWRKGGLRSTRTVFRLLAEVHELRHRKDEREDRPLCEQEWPQRAPQDAAPYGLL